MLGGGRGTPRVHQEGERLGLSLDEIRDILKIRALSQSPYVHVLALLDQKLEQVDAVIRQLEESAKHYSSSARTHMKSQSKRLASRVIAASSRKESMPMARWPWPESKNQASARLGNKPLDSDLDWKVYRFLAASS